MNIQSGYGINSYQGADRIGISRLGASTTKSNLADVSGLQGAAASSVSISDAARKLASQDVTPTQGRTAAQERLLNAASDPQTAEKLAYDMAYTKSNILYDLRGVGGGDPVTKMASGRTIDDAFKANFASDASTIDAQRRALYDSEKAKGTPADQILSKLFDFTNAQSKDYLEATGWLESTT